MGITLLLLLVSIITESSVAIMRVLVVSLLVGSCMANPLIQTPVTIGAQPWTAYTFAHNSHPAVVRIAAPNIKFATPHFPTIVSANPVVAAPFPVVKSVAAPIPVVKSAAPVFTPVAVPAVAGPSSVLVAAAPEPLQAPEPPMPSVGTPFVGGQFHAQDEAGQYSFGHWGGPNTRVETRDYLGRTSGSFAYVDPVGDVQVRKYAADPASGFRVAASDLPVNNQMAVQDTPEVAQVKAAHARAYAAVKALG